MAKKKSVEPNEDLEDEFSEVDEEEIESVYPEVKSNEKDETVDSVPDTSDLSEEESEEEIEEEFEFEPEPEIPDFKHLKLILNQKLLESDYELEILGQSHGFCNIFVKHLLNIEGVKMAAYKVTRIDPSKVFIRLSDKKYKIKEILFKGIESLREEVGNVQNLFQ